MMHQSQLLSSLAAPVRLDGRGVPVEEGKSPPTAANVVLTMAIAAILLLATFFWPRIDAFLFSPPHGAQSVAIGEIRGFIEDLPAAVELPAAETTLQQTAEPNQTVVIPGHPVRTGLLLLHIVGLVLGFGSALFLDLYLVSRLYHRAIEPHSAEFLHFGSRIVLAGLAALWVSGVGLLAFYFAFAPAALDNPKLAAKIAVVIVLTLNGALLHNIVMPRVQSRIGQPLLRGLPLRAALVLLAAGVVSGASWAVAMLFGIVKELNYAVPAFTLLAIYLTILLSGIATAAFMHARLSIPDPLQARLSRLRQTMLPAS